MFNYFVKMLLKILLLAMFMHDRIRNKGTLNLGVQDLLVRHLNHQSVEKQTQS